MEKHHENCIMCHSDTLQRMDKFKMVSLVRCAKCKLVFAHKIPTEAELSAYYSNYGQEHYLSPVTIKRYNEWLDQFEKYRKTNCILDVGCGSGFFLEEAARRNWKIYGTEFSDDLVKICKKKNIIMSQGTLQNSTHNGIEFDIILSIEVIEHINHPNQDLVQVSRLLRKGGLFFCTTPNFNAVSRYWLKDKYNIIAWPEHLTYYTAKTLGKLMKKHQFKVIRTTTTGFSFTRWKGSTGAKKEKVISATSDDEKLRLRSETSGLLRWAKLTLNFIFNLTGTGTSLKGWFEKL
jgi:2-polyprenyl-3-methyl-5-hydroxy-6-metoxy-1,4-benzoquinol methylase